MQWTKEIPTENGWYWIRFKDSPTWIAEIADSCILWYEELSPITAEGFEFYGPLEEPK